MKQQLKTGDEVDLVSKARKRGVISRIPGTW